MALTDLTSQIQTCFRNPGAPLVGIPLNIQQIHLLLDNKLLPLLPYPITVIRRIQFELNNPSPTAQVYLTLTAPFNVSPSADQATVSDAVTAFLSESSASPPPPTHPYLVTYIDLTPAGQTQAWIFSTSEIPTTHSPPFSTYPPTPPADPITSPPLRPSTRPLPLIRLLFSHLLIHLIPLRPDTPPADWLWLRDNEKYLSQPYSTRKVLFGTVHSSLIPFFSLPGQSRRDGQYHKLLLPPTQTAAPPAALSNGDDHISVLQGYRLITPMQDADLHTVLNRSPIPRTISTLRALPSVALYTTASTGTTTPATAAAECVGWGFLSTDGSISSLHVEPEHRGQGLAVCLTQALLGRQAETFARKGARLANGTAAVEEGKQSWWGVADVEESNVASNRVMGKLGGITWWGVQWVEVDVQKVLEGLEGMEDN